MSEGPRAIPHSTEAEQGVLGCCMLDPSKIPVVVKSIKGDLEAFYDLRHRSLFAELSGLVDEGKPPELITVQQRLKDKGILDGVGGLAYIASLPDVVPSAENVEYYLVILNEKHFLRKLLLTCQNVAGSVFEFSGDVDKLKSKVEQDFFSICQKDAPEASRKDSFRAIIDRLERASTGNGLAGLSTGLHPVDRILGGLRPGTMNVFAARPGLGKSSLALGIAEFNAASGIPCCFMSFEMSQDELNLRSLCSISGVNSRHAISGTLSQMEQLKIGENIAKVSRLPIHICDRGDMNIAQVRSEARRMKFKHNVGLIVVDYLQLVSGSGRNGRREDVDEISRGIKLMAKELNIPVIALAQLSREIERDAGRRPRLSDLRESGGIEQDADTVSFIYCPDETRIMDDGTLPVRLSTQKNRGGDIGECDLLFERALTRFSAPSMVSQ